MGFPSTWRWALLFCGLVLNQQVITASHLHHDHVTMTRALRRYQDKEDLGGDRFDDGAMPSYRNSTSGISRHTKAHKRFFFLTLFIVSLIVTVVATTVETIYDIAGCCGLGFKSLCNFEKDFDNRKKAVTARSKALDTKIKAGLKTKEEMEKVGNSLQATGKHIDRIITLQNEILDATNPKLREALKKKIDKIKNENDLDGMELGVIDQKLAPLQQALKQSMSWGLGVGVPVVEKITTSALKHAKITKIYKSLKVPKASSIFNGGSKAQKMLGFSDDAAKTFLKTTAKARFAATGTKAMKFMKLMKGAGAVMSIVSIGLDLYSLISTFVECGRKQSQARDAMAKVEKAESDLTLDEQKFAQFEIELKKYDRDNLMPQVRKTELQDALDGVKSVFEYLDKTVKRNWSVQECVDKIDSVKNILKTSNDHSVISSQLDDMNSNCLQKLEYTLTCKLDKVKIIKHVEDGCMAGSKTFSELFTEASNMFNGNSAECKNKHGQPYTSKDELKGMIGKSAQTKKYNPDCKMNDKTLQLLICAKKGKGVSSLVEEFKISASNVEEILKECNNDLSRKQMIEICQFRSYELSDEEIPPLVQGVTLAQIKKVTCPLN
ncbi:uncharacterized protein LOC5518281 [Nematostella vectensis]|uniref:uncharacterized protein LOC5518281 n=1 Tax=Nematostella vectensis TaxID=45351 RepID=UPI00138FF3E7|nr:uncharacterized protein LOC5518281 [Nematostella vectensis]